MGANARDVAGERGGWVANEVCGQGERVRSEMGEGYRLRGGGAQQERIRISISIYSRKARVVRLLGAPNEKTLAL